MTLPRRPILSAICAALTLAVMGLWVRGMWVRDSWTWYHSFRETAVGMGAGQVWFWSGDPLAAPTHDQFIVVQDPTEDADPAKIHSWWFHVDNDPGGRGLSVPMWFVALMSSSGVWWGWRRRRVGAGFPVSVSSSTI